MPTVPNVVYGSLIVFVGLYLLLFELNLIKNQGIHVYFFILKYLKINKIHLIIQYPKMQIFKNSKIKI